MTSVGPLARTQPFGAAAGDDAVDRILARFRNGSALVAAALATIEVLAPRIAEMSAAIPTLRGSPLLANLARLVAAAKDLIIDTGSIGTENLLVHEQARQTAFLVLGLAREASGKLSVQPIEIDRDQIVLVGGGEAPWDRLERAVSRLPSPPDDTALQTLRGALDAVDARITIARSRLSVVKTRLDLQESFLTAIVESEPTAAVVRLDSHLDQSGAQRMALEARRLLSRQSFTIGNANRAALRTLFERHAATGG